MISDDISGIGIANRGIYEYEILPDNSVAVTLVRAVSELGDWGVFPTTLSQQQKFLSLEYQITPFADENVAIEELSKFRHPVVYVQNFECKNEVDISSKILYSGDMIRMTALKCAQNSNDIVMRFVNYSDKQQTLSIEKTNLIDNIYMSNVIEQKICKVDENNGKWYIEVKPFEIVTLGTEK